MKELGLILLGIIMGAAGFGYIALQLYRRAQSVEGSGPNSIQHTGENVCAVLRNPIRKQVIMNRSE